MPTIHMQCIWQNSSLLPGDVAVINPHFHVDDGLIWGDVDYNNLANDLATALNGWGAAGTTRQLTVKAYEVKHPVAGQPNRPKATVIKNANAVGTSAGPGEVALCLSYSSGDAGPRKRGRLYLPAWQLTNSAPTARPTGSTISQAAALPPIFASLGGINVDWVVWSRADWASHTVDHWYVDDEWDTQRRRGLKPTTRTSGSTSG